MARHSTPAEILAVRLAGDGAGEVECWQLDEAMLARVIAEHERERMLVDELRDWREGGA